MNDTEFTQRPTLIKKNKPSQEYLNLHFSWDLKLESS